MKQTIYQLVAGFRRGDAISNSATLMRSVFLSWGNPSKILCEKGRFDPTAGEGVCDIESIEKDISPDDIAILHFSIGCGINERFKKLNCRKVIMYHNVTPSHYFKYLTPALAVDLDLGRQQLASLVGVAELNLAVSKYNAKELEELGFSNVGVLPLPIDMSMFSGGVSDASLVRRFDDGVFNILFVGRCVPNKKLEDLLSVIYFLQQGIERNVRFIHVGSYIGCESYYGLLQSRAKMFQLNNVLFMGTVTQPELNACYASADAFLCLSEHEGFCAPLIEAMTHKIPVFALDAAAVAETLDGSGVVFSAPPDFPLIAETIAEVLHNDDLKNAIIEKQDKRLEAFNNRDLAAEMQEALKSMLNV